MLAESLERARIASSFLVLRFFCLGVASFSASLLMASGNEALVGVLGVSEAGFAALVLLPPKGAANHPGNVAVDFVALRWVRAGACIPLAPGEESKVERCAAGEVCNWLAPEGE